MKEYLKNAPLHPTSFSVGDMVLIEPTKRPPKSKLQPRWIGPFVVITTTGQSYEVQDLNTGKIRQTHVTRMKLYRNDPKHQPANVATWDSELHVIENIVSHSPGQTPARWKFKVRWADFGPSGDTWEPTKNVCKTAVFARYIRDHQLAAFPPSKYPLLPEETDML